MEIMKIHSMLSLIPFFEGMFEKERLLDIIKNFICFSNDGSQQIKNFGRIPSVFCSK